MGSFFSKKFDPLTDTLPLSGKVAIVTGGNSGIGFATVLHLARKGCKVYLAARNEQKAHDALRRLKEAGLGPGNGEIVWLKVDLSDLHGTQAAAREVLAKEQRLDILVNNAALTLVDPHVGETGVEDVLLTNHFGHFVFTQTLLPLLKRTASEDGSDVRIVNVSSDAFRLVPNDIRFATKEDFTRLYKDKTLGELTRYAVSKLANILYTNELQRRLNEENMPIICISLHPGSVATEGVENMKRLPMGFIFPYLAPLLFTPADEGSYTTVIAAASPKVRAEPEKYKGCYMVPVGKIPSPAMGASTKVSRDPDLAKELWSTTEKILSDLEVSIY